jgi:hypothetical protein
VAVEGAADVVVENHDLEVVVGTDSPAEEEGGVAIEGGDTLEDCADFGRALAWVLVGPRPRKAEVLVALVVVPKQEHMRLDHSLPVDEAVVLDTAAGHWDSVPQTFDSRRRRRVGKWVVVVVAGKDKDSSRMVQDMEVGTSKREKQAARILEVDRWNQGIPSQAGSSEPGSD